MIDVLLTALQLARFLGRQLTVLQALFDASLLIDIALLIGRYGLRKRRACQYAARQHRQTNAHGFHALSFGQIAQLMGV
jgi:hypothetical protein